MSGKNNAEPRPWPAIIYNPVKIRVETLIEAFAKVRKNYSWAEPRWYITSVEDPGAGAAKRALEDGASIIVAAGGDGTVRSVAEGLYKSDVPLALLPTGTGNLLARNLQLNVKHLEEAVDCVYSGSDEYIDVGLVSAKTVEGKNLVDSVFLVMAGIGIDAAMIANTPVAVKKRLGWLGYLIGGLKSLSTQRKIPITFQFDASTKKKTDIHGFLAGNCGILPMNLKLIPDAKINDGQLDFVAIRPKTFWGWNKVWWEILQQNTFKSSGGKVRGRKKRAVKYYRNPNVNIISEVATELQLDGDLFGRVTEIDIRVAPGALKVRTFGEATDSVS